MLGRCVHVPATSWSLVFCVHSLAGALAVKAGVAVSVFAAIGASPLVTALVAYAMTHGLHMPCNSRSLIGATTSSSTLSKLVPPPKRASCCVSAVVMLPRAAAARVAVQPAPTARFW